IPLAIAYDSQDSWLFPIIGLHSFPQDPYNAEYQALVMQADPLINCLKPDHYKHSEAFWTVSPGIMVAVQYKHNHVLLMVSYIDRKRLVIMFEYVHHPHPHPS